MFCSKCGTQLSDESVFCYKCGEKTVSGATTEIVPDYKQEVQPSMQGPTSAEIKEYLGHAKRLEVHRYTLLVAKDRLQQMINSLGHRKSISSPVSKVSTAFSSFWPVFWTVFILGVFVSACVCGDASDSFIANIISIITVVLLFFNGELLVGVIISLGVAVASGLLICSVKAIAKNAEHKKEMKEYAKKVAKDKERVELEKRQISALRKQQSDLDFEISEIDSMLEKLYDLDVVKPKYRELVPIVTMHEYFENERCYSLIGPTGAYNLYEDELLHQRIIANLNQVISMLSRIERNQRALYDAIQESNSYAEQMCMKADDMLRSNRVVEQNTAIAAYHSKISAENTAISAYINYCNF